MRFVAENFCASLAIQTLLESNQSIRITPAIIIVHQVRYTLRNIVPIASASLRVYGTVECIQVHGTERLETWC
jgi:hypothetical protein